VLAGDEVETIWSRRAVSEIAIARDETTVARSTHTVINSDRKDDRAKWWTFGGLKANASIAEMFKSRDIYARRFDNYFVEMPNHADLPNPEKLLEEMGITPFRELPVPSDPPVRVKFWECLPNSLLAQFIESRFTDAARAIQLLSEPRVHVRPWYNSAGST
jgi:ATP-dependent Lhr-like helicase